MAFDWIGHQADKDWFISYTPWMPAPELVNGEPSWVTGPGGLDAEYVTSLPEEQRPKLIPKPTPNANPRRPAKIQVSGNYCEASNLVNKSPDRKSPVKILTPLPPPCDSPLTVAQKFWGLRAAKNNLEAFKLLHEDIEWNFKGEQMSGYQNVIKKFGDFDNSGVQITWEGNPTK